MPNDPLRPDTQSAPQAVISQPASSVSTKAATSPPQPQASSSAKAPVAVIEAAVQQQKAPKAAETSGSGMSRPTSQAREASSGLLHSPEFDASFAGEAETMFDAGQGIQFK